MTKIQRVIFAVSMTAVWGLLMPPYLYGILGIPVMFVFALVIGRQLPDMWKLIREKFCVWELLPIILFLYMFGAEFYERWFRSSKLAAIAGILGMGVDAFLVLVMIAASLVAAVGLLYIICAACKAVPQKELSKSVEGTLERRLLPADIFFALMVALCLGMRLAVNPWSGVWPDTDSAVFLYVGTRMRNGMVPYTDIFDHKGILLYLIEVIGLSITDGSWTGVWILEVINAFVTALLIFKIAKLFTKKRTVQYITVASSIAALTVCMLLTDGNLTEEWALPWITLAVYIFLKYFVDGTYRFYDIILLGIGFAFIVFLRANMIAVWIAFMPLILIGMIREKKWRDIGICIANFLIGCAVVTVPIVVYSIAAGNFQDMVECYFVFNFAYSGKAAMPVWKVMWLLFRRLTIYSVVLLGATKIFYRNHVFQMNLWFYGISLVLASMSGRAHAHYAIILIPALIVPTVLLLDRIEGVSFRRPVAVLTVLACVFFAAEFVNSFLGNGEPELSGVAVYLKENTSEDDNVLMLGNNCIYYLQSGRYTTNRFCFQTPPINVSDELYTQYQEAIEANKPDAIVLVGDKEALFEEDDNYADAIRTLDEWCDEGVYTYVECDGFGVYVLETGE